MRKRRTTSKTSSVRTRSIARAKRALLVLLGALALATSPALARRDAPPAIAEVFARYARASGSDRAPQTFETAGTLRGDGLAGTFHTWRDGTDERDEEHLGERSETTLRLGSRLFIQNASGNVRELKGLLYRRALTSDYVDSDAFLREPERARYVATKSIDERPAIGIEVRATGGEPETLWFDAANGLIVRLEYLDGDGPTTVDLRDYRSVEGLLVAYTTVTSDGDTAFDIVETTTSVLVNKPVDPAHFALLRSRVLLGSGVQVLPLEERGGHYYVRVKVNGKPYIFLIDTGAQSLLLDSHVAKELAIPEEGSLEVRGTARGGGLHTVHIASFSVGDLHLDDIVASSLDIGGSAAGALRFDGILGYPFFAAALVELDFGKKSMRVGAPGSFTPRGERVPIELDRAIPEATLGVNGHYRAPFIIDTGSSSDVLLFRWFVDLHPGVVPFTAQQGLNYGLGGATSAYRSSLDELTIGSTPMYHRYTDVMLANQGAFADRSDAGNVGLGVLRNFVLTLDESNLALFIERASDFDDGRSRKQFATVR